MYWQGDVVSFLRDCKDHGWEFEPAWEAALLRFPPRGTGFGNGRKQQNQRQHGCGIRVVGIRDR